MENVDTEFVDALVMNCSGSFNQIGVVKWPLASKCAAGEVKVCVDYCGVNFADVYHVQGILVQRTPPFVFGLECVGTVVEVGDDVNKIKLGDRVICYNADGGLFQEKIIVHESRCFCVPEYMTSDDAAALLTNYLTAYFSLFKSANLTSGMSVLVHSVAGGVGWAATQLARTIPDVKIYGLCSEFKHSIVKSNGVDVTLTYDNYLATLKKENIKFDIIIDNIGGDSVDQSLDLLKPLGHVVIIGANCVVYQDKKVVTAALLSLANKVDLSTLLMGNKSVGGLHLGTLIANDRDKVYDAVQNLFQLYQQRKIKPRIDSVWDFEKGSEAIRSIGERKNIGKVLLKIRHDLV